MIRFYLYAAIIAVLLFAGCETTPTVTTTIRDDGSSVTTVESPPLDVDLPVDEPWWPIVTGILGAVLFGNQTKRIPIEKVTAIIGK